MMKNGMHTIIVPKDKSSLEFLLELERKINDEWILLSSDVFEELSQSAEQFFREQLADGNKQYCMKWKSNTEHPKVTLSCTDVENTCRKRLTCLKYSGNRFNYYIPTAPNGIIFLDFEQKK